MFDEIGLPASYCVLINHAKLPKTLTEALHGSKRCCNRLLACVVTCLEYVSVDEDESHSEMSLAQRPTWQEPATATTNSVKYDVGMSVHGGGQGHTHQRPANKQLKHGL